MNENLSNIKKKSNNYLAVFVAVLVTGIVVGSAVYYWQKSIVTIKLKDTRESLQQQIDSLRKEITQKQQNPNEVANDIINTDYLMALHVADLFLTACIKRDAESGIALLSDRLKSLYTKDDLYLAISGTSNPHYQAFEVFNGTCVDKDTYVFQVHLFEHYTGQQVAIQKGISKKLRVVRTYNDTWMIDSFSEMF